MEETAEVLEILTSMVLIHLQLTNIVEVEENGSNE